MNLINKIYFSKIKPNAIIPSKRAEDAGYDLYACFEEDYILLKPSEVKLIPTGVAWAASSEYYLQIEERSSTGKANMKKNGGVFDSGYRGDITIELFNARTENLIISNLSEEELKAKYPELIKPYFFFSAKKAIAQGVVHRLPILEAEEISYDDLLKISSQRGADRFGSTNKK